jgi:hypothetical protein
MNIIKRLIEEIFYISLITFLVFFVLELLKEGLISNYFDLNLFLIWTIIFGILTIILKKYD